METAESMVLGGIKNAIVEGNHKDMAELMKKALDLGYKPELILNEYMIAAMVEVGNRFEAHEAFIPEMMLAAKAMTVGFQLLEPLLANEGGLSSGTIVLGTAKGDFHDIGKNIVAAMMKGTGLKVIDLGVDVSSESFIAAAQSNHAELIGISALLTTTMIHMEKTVEMLSKQGLRNEIKLMVGGGVVTEAFASEIGADYYAPDANSAARMAKNILINLGRQ